MTPALPTPTGAVPTGTAAELDSPPATPTPSASAELESEPSATGSEPDTEAAALFALTRVTVGQDGAPANGDSFGRVAVSADGRYIAFSSRASNLVDSDTLEGGGVFVFDRETGEMARVSVSAAGAPINAGDDPTISADGRYVAFTSDSSEFVPDDTDVCRDIFVRDRVAGTTERVGECTRAISFSDLSMSADGRYIAFSTLAPLVPEDTNQLIDVYVVDRETGAFERVSVSSSGEQVEVDEPSTAPGHRDSAISGDGRFVAFPSFASSLVPNDTNPGVDLFIHDRETGETTLVSVNSEGQQSDGNASPFAPAISADGRYVAFDSSLDTLVPGDTFGFRDIFVRDRELGETVRVSVTSAGEQASGGSLYPPAMSADGRYVLFLSDAGNLAGRDPRIVENDLFLHARETGETLLVTSDVDGAQLGCGCRHLALSGDGGVIVFTAERDAALLPGDSGEEWDVFVAVRK